MNDRRDSTQPNLRAARPVSAPPGCLLWLVVGLFILFMAAAVYAFVSYSTEGRLISLVQPILIALVAAAAYIWLLSLLFRRSLPRRLSLWLLIGYALLILVGVPLGITLYQNNLPPRYQAELITPLPFLSAFLPPTPQGGTIPTVAATPGGRSAQDLLLGLGGTPTQQATPTLQPPTPTIQPSATLAQPSPAISPTMQAASITPSPTQALPSPTQTPQVTTAPTQAAYNLPVSHYNGGFRYFRQTWNNCGPANIAQALSYYGWQGSQEEAASFLKPDREDKNVSPSELVRFVNSQTSVRALTRIGGSLSMMKAFIAAGFPVVVEVGGALYEGEDWIGHYRTLVGYDDLNGVFLVFDSWLGNGDGSGIAVSYAEMDATWQPFSRVFIVVYEPQREPEVVSILGELATVARANELALETAREEARANPQNGFAWFNIGTALTRLGRYSEAGLAFDEANRFRLPFRMIWYQFYPFEAYYNEGRYSDVMALVNSNLNSGGVYLEETHYWRGRILQAEGDIAGARAAFQRALRLNSRYAEAQEALNQLPSA
jgi:hypothetical protein